MSLPRFVNHGINHSDSASYRSCEMPHTQVRTEHKQPKLIRFVLDSFYHPFFNSHADEGGAGLA